MLLLPKLKRPKAKMRLKGKFWSKAALEAKLWPEGQMLRLLLEMLMVPFIPSQNILQSLQKWKDILEYLTINLVATL